MSEYGYYFNKGEHVMMFGATGGAFMATVLQSNEDSVEVILGRNHYHFTQGSGVEKRGMGWCHRFIRPFEIKPTVGPGALPDINEANLLLSTLCGVNFYLTSMGKEDAEALKQALQGAVDVVVKHIIPENIVKSRGVALRKPVQAEETGGPKPVQTQRRALR